MKAILPTLILSSVILSLIFFPLGYVGSYNTFDNVPPFSLSRNYSNLSTGENHNLESGRWQANNASLTMLANNVIDPNNWAFLSVISPVNFPMGAGTILNFSGRFAGLDTNTSAVRVSLILAHSSDVITLYYLVGNPSTPANQGNYRYYYVPIQSVSDSFFARRDIVQDLSSLDTGADPSWEIRSVSYGFVIYSPSFKARFPVQVGFDSNSTGLSYSGLSSHSQYSGSYILPFYFIPVLFLVAMTGLQVLDMSSRKHLASVSDGLR